jgi:ankyrin repeat protein
VFSHIIGGLVVLVLVNAAAYGVLMANRHHPAASQKRKHEAFQAVQKDDAPRLERLIARGLDLQAEEAGRTLLHVADDPACVRVLLASGANVNARTGEQQTPLMLAASRGLREIAQLLLAAQADVRLVSAHQMTALDYAVRSGHEDIAELIRRAGGKPAPPAEEPQP